MSRKKKAEVIIPDPPITVRGGVPVVVESQSATDRVTIGGVVLHASGKVDWPCPTCGTAKTGNRCDVCGHQEKDT